MQRGKAGSYPNKDVLLPITSNVSNLIYSRPRPLSCLLTLKRTFTMYHGLQTFTSSASCLIRAILYPARLRNHDPAFLLNTDGALPTCFHLEPRDNRRGRLTLLRVTRSLAVGCCLLFGLCSALVRADSLVLSDNLAALTAYTEPVQGQTWIGAAFHSDGGAMLTSASLLLANGAAGDAKLDLYSGAEEPETLVGSLTSPASYSSQPTPTTFSGNGLALTADTSYWLVLNARSGQFAWAYTESSTGSGVGFVSTWGVTNDAGSTWFTQASQPMQMRVETNALQTIPEPANLSLFLLGIFLVGSFAAADRQSRKCATHGRSLVVLGGITIPLLLWGAHTAEAATNPVSVVSPGYGESVTTPSSVSFTLQVAPAMVGTPLQVTLNGADVSTQLRRSGHCGANGCPYQGTVQEVDGLRSGTNRLRAGVKDETGVLHSWRTVFEWAPSGQPQSGNSSYTSPAVGLTTVTPGGGYPWISILSGKGLARY